MTLGSIVWMVTEKKDKEGSEGCDMEIVGRRWRGGRALEMVDARFLNSEVRD
jgi:hypothetical protein